MMVDFDYSTLAGLGISMEEFGEELMKLAPAIAKLYEDVWLPALTLRLELQQQGELEHVRKWGRAGVD